MPTPDGLADDVNRFFGPDEGRGVSVLVLDVVADVSDESFDGRE